MSRIQLVKGLCDKWGDKWAASMPLSAEECLYGRVYDYWRGRLIDLLRVKV